MWARFSCRPHETRHRTSRLLYVLAVRARIRGTAVVPCRHTQWLNFDTPQHYSHETTAPHSQGNEAPQAALSPHPCISRAMVVMVVVALPLLCVIGEGIDRPAGGEVTKALAGDRRISDRSCCACISTAAHLHMLLVVTMVLPPIQCPLCVTRVCSLFSVHTLCSKRLRRIPGIIRVQFRLEAVGFWDPGTS